MAGFFNINGGTGSSNPVAPVNATDNDVIPGTNLLRGVSVTVVPVDENDDPLTDWPEGATVTFDLNFWQDGGQVELDPTWDAETTLAAINADAPTLTDSSFSISGVERPDEFTWNFYLTYPFNTGGFYVSPFTGASVPATTSDSGIFEYIPPALLEPSGTDIYWEGARILIQNHPDVPAGIYVAGEGPWDLVEPVTGFAEGTLLATQSAQLFVLLAGRFRPAIYIT
jgi:fermentation-respiration switch protein FrsA (DUF1100 family)